MAKLVEPLGPDEAAVVTGRWSSQVRVVMGGRVIRRPGEVVTRVPLALQRIELRVECTSQDRVPLVIDVAGSYRVAPSENAILAVARDYRADRELISATVANFCLGVLRSVIGRCQAASVDQDTEVIIAAVMDRLRPLLAGRGLMFDHLVILGVRVSEHYSTARLDLQADDARRAKIAREMAIEEDIQRAQSVREEQPKRIQWMMADLDGERRRLEIELIEEKLKLIRAERQAHLDRVEAERETEQLRVTLETQQAYIDALTQQQILARLPEILEAKGKLRPNLRTYIAGSSEQNLPDLLSGLAEFGPDVMSELSLLVSNIVAGDLNGREAPVAQLPPVADSPDVGFQPDRGPDPGSTDAAARRE